MIINATLFLLVLTVSQAIAASILNLRSVEILETRQPPECSRFCNGLVPANCKVVSCVCTPDVAGRVQECVNCGAGGYDIRNVTQSTVDSVLDLIDLYTHTCAGLPNITPPKWPFWVTTQITTRARPTQYPSTTTPGAPQAVTIIGGSTHSVVGDPPSKSGAEKGKQASFAVIGAMLGAALSATASSWISS